MAKKLTTFGPNLTSGDLGDGGGGGSKGLPKTMQITCYHVGDDGDLEKGITQSFTPYTTGQYSGTTAIDTAHYAANTISFTAPSTISDAAAGLVTILTNDTIRVRGSGLNDGVYTVAAGGVAGSFTVNEVTIVNEIAGAYITLCKRSAPSNNCVQDNVTGLMWKRAHTGTTGSIEKVGTTSTGALNYYDVATCFTIHPAAADLQMMTTGIKIVGGAGEIARYYVGMCIDCTGFANAVNNIPGYVITAVTVNGADLDLTLWRGNNTLIAEAAAGARSIMVICRSIFTYCAAANAASYAGYTNWRIPNDLETVSIRDMEAPGATPNAVAFPNWPGGVGSASAVWTSIANPTNTARKYAILYQNGSIADSAATTAYFCELVR